ncbi:major capsid protein [Lysobacter sp. LF1]|uniref:Major capsid protein n=1 Tax=Lysobacter stagni TaxID=3045172 RepID=A0ABT6XL25_9GAMM|nr:major capsid protein [Lysobacter sp. LF1]MDI9240743.1 major capsid protein [Lysobacter sp. LF1]
MDIYSTTRLNRLVQSLKRPQTALLTAFFPELETSDTEDIKFDVANKRRRIAPFVHPLREGRLVEDEGYVTNSFTPAYTKDKRYHDPAKALKRRAGERIGGDSAPMDRHQANLSISTADQIEMLVRRKEVMAGEVLATGRVTVKGDGYPTVVVDFGRKASHTVVLTGANRWGQQGVKPVEMLEDWTALILQDSGATIRDVVMDTKAWRLFREDEEVKKHLDTRPLSASTDAIVALQFAQLGLTFKGELNGLRFWIYQDWYVDETGEEDENGIPKLDEKPILPEFTVILASPDVQGVQHHGAIMDLDAGLQPLEFFSKSWTKPDPSRRILMMQSAPLVVPYRPDATFAATVSDGEG